MTTFSYFEPLVEGHCTFWAAEILRQAASDPRISHVELVASGELIERVKPICDNMGVEMIIIASQSLVRMTSGNLMSRAKSQWGEAVAISKRSAGQVFLPFFDQAAVAAALDVRQSAADSRISGVIFRPPNSYGSLKGPLQFADHMRRWATYSLASRKTKALLTLDETAPLSKLGRLTKVLKPLADPALDFTHFKKSKTCKTNNCKEWLLFGSLTARKGIFQILDAWAMKDVEFHQRNKLKFVGKIGAEDRESFLARFKYVKGLHSDINIELQDRYVSDDELFSLVQQADVILAPYQDHIGSSGVLYWAAAAGKPVLTQKTGLMGYQAQRYRLGTAIDTTNPAEIARYLDHEIPFETNRDFLAAHSLENFSKTIIDAVMQ